MPPKKKPKSKGGSHPHSQHALVKDKSIQLDKDHGPRLSRASKSSNRDAAEIFLELQKIKAMKKFLNENAEIMQEFTKHLDLAEIVSKDEKLAKSIVADPGIWREMVQSKEKQEKRSSREKRSHKLSASSTASHRSDRSDRSHKHGHKHGHPSIASSTSTLAPHHNASRNTIPSISITDVSSKTAAVPVGPHPHSRSSKGAEHAHGVYPFDGEVLPPNAQVGLQEMSQATYFSLHRHIASNDKFVVCGEVLNHFDIANVKGNKIYRAFEGSETCCNAIFPAFSITIQEIDVDGVVVDEVLAKMVKKYHHIITARRYIQVYSPSDFYIGAVKQAWCSPQQATFILIDYAGTSLIEIVVNRYPFSRYKLSEFELRNIATKEMIGTISGKYIEAANPKLAGKYKYEVKFPKNLNCNLKLLVMAAWLIIYKLYFDKELRKEWIGRTPEQKKVNEAKAALRKAEMKGYKVKKVLKKKPNPPPP